MTTITKIVFPVPNENLGDTTDAECDNYREWFAAQLQAEYPAADVTVTDRPGRIAVDTDDDGNDENLIAELHEFGNRCWDRCPWNWVPAPSHP